MDQVLAGLRPFNPGDIEALTRLLIAARAWPPAAVPAPEDVLLRWERRGVNPPADVSVLPDDNGDLIAFAQAVSFKDGTPRLAFELGVHPENRRRGIGSALYRMVTGRARGLAVAHLTSPVYRRDGEERPESTGFLERRGFRPDHSYWQLRLDEINRQPLPQWPGAIGVRTFRGDDRDAETWARLIVEAFGEAATAEGIRAQMREPGVSPDGYFFAVDLETGEEIGTSRGRIDMLGGKPVGYVGTVGVIPRYRGRGIATALMGQTLAYLAGRGMCSATLFVEHRNIAARRLYDKLGWYSVYRTDHYWKRLESDEEKADGRHR
ncbi:MAG TPA: GNAT family N-acetyltransferase [Chloroflexia bacterium]|nr:GNAT family N-acetyltransferase [Chloroflexia bacterium]